MTSGHPGNYTSLTDVTQRFKMHTTRICGLFRLPSQQVPKFLGSLRHRSLTHQLMRVYA